MSDECHYMQAKCGRLKEFEAMLQILRGENADISQEAADIIVIFFCSNFMKEQLTLKTSNAIGFPRFSGIYRKLSMDIWRWSSAPIPGKICLFNHSKHYQLFLRVAYYLQYLLWCQENLKLF